MVQPRKLVIVAGAAAAALVVLRRGRHGARGHQVPGGILIGDAVLYDALSRLLLGPFLDASPPMSPRSRPTAPGSSRSGAARPPVDPAGRRHGFDVTGLDLDPAMIARAQANTDRAGTAAAPTIVPSRRRGRASLPRPILRPGQHPVDAPLGRPGSRPGRDRPCAPPRRPSADLDFRPRVRPHSFGPCHAAHPRSGRQRA